MKVAIDIPTPPSEQRIINIPIHFCGGQVVDAGGYGFEEQKTGKWIVWKDCEGKTREITCSECGCQRRTWVNPNYCEDCGAKMEVEDNEMV